MDETVGSKLSVLKRRAGMSLAEIAREAGYNGPSSVQAYFNPAYDAVPNTGTAGRLAAALSGKGNPPITADEVLQITGMPDEAVERLGRRLDGAITKYRAARENLYVPEPANSPPSVPYSTAAALPIYSSILGEDARFGGPNSKKPIEVTQFAMGYPIAEVPRPPAMQSSSAYGLFISGSSMVPRLHAGDLILVDTRRPPAIGDDVVVHLEGESDDQVGGLIKTLVSRTSISVGLRQYSPDVTFDVPASRIAHIYRVIPLREVLGV